jgi:hypothetical protein
MVRAGGDHFMMLTVLTQPTDDKRATAIPSVINTTSVKGLFDKAAPRATDLWRKAETAFALATQDGDLMPKCDEFKFPAGAATKRNESSEPIAEVIAIMPTTVRRRREKSLHSRKFRRP